MNISFGKSSLFLNNNRLFIDETYVYPYIVSSVKFNVLHFLR